MTEYKIDIRNAKNWQDLPNPWTIVKKISKVDIKYNLNDSKFIGLFEPFFNKEGLRPSQNGLLIDGNKLVATDAHKLIQLKNEGKLEDGNFLISSKIAKKTGNKLGKITEKFPDWERIIEGSTEIVSEITPLQLKTYCEAVIKGKYCNSVTNKITFLVQLGYRFAGKENITISLNAEMLIDILETFLKLGYKKIYCGYTNKSMYFAESAEAAKNPKNAIGKQNFALLMGMFNTEEYLGSKDIDFETEISCYYSFEDDKIHNSDGEIAFFNSNQTSKDLPYISEVNFDMLKKVAGNNKQFPLLENILVENYKATAHDFTQLVSIQDVNVEDGIYELVSGAFKDTSENIDNFPKAIDTKLFNIIGKIDTLELSKSVIEAKDFVGNDDLRPAQKGIAYIYKNSVLNIFATNSYILYKKQIYSKDLTNEFNNILMNPKIQAYMFENMDSDTYCQVSVSDDKLYFSFENGNVKYITNSGDNIKTIDYESVIYKNTNRILSIDKKGLLEIIYSLKGEDAKDNLTFKFEYDFPTQTSISGVFKLYTSSQYDRITTLKKDLNISFAFDSFEFDMGWEESDTALIMPIVTDDNTILSFNPKLLSTFLSVNQTIENIYFRSDAKNGTFLVELDSIYAAIIKKPNLTISTSTKTPLPKVQSKEDIEKIIKGLNVLVKMGNIAAEQKIKVYKIILKSY